VKTMSNITKRIVLLAVCASVVSALCGDVWANSSLRVDFESSTRGPSLGSPAGWSSFNDVDITNGDTASVTFGDITVSITNENTNRNGGLNLHFSSWIDPPYSPSGPLAGLIQDHLYVHDSESGDRVKIRVNISGLYTDQPYQVTTWHNSGYSHLAAPARIDIYAGDDLVVDDLQQSLAASNSDAASKAVFTAIADAEGNITLDFVACNTTSGGAWESNNVVINGFELVPHPTATSIVFAEHDSSELEWVGTAAVVDVLLVNPQAGQSYTVDYAAIGGTARDGVDYSLAPGTLTFNPGETTKTISIDITNDGLDESDETIILELSNPTGPGVYVFNARHTYTIVDPRPEISFAAESSSGIEDGRPVFIEVVLSNPYPETVAIDYAATGGTATNGADYDLPPGTLTFAPGVVSQHITFIVVNDWQWEPETIVLTLSNPAEPGQMGAITQHTYTIGDKGGLQWDGKTWYYSELPSRIFINSDGDLEWAPIAGGQFITRIQEQRLSQTGDAVEMSYIWMTDGLHECSDCFDCDAYCFDWDITCIAGTGDMRVGLFEADGEFVEESGLQAGNEIIRGYKGYNFRFGPNMVEGPNRWVDCTGEVHKTGYFVKTDPDTDALMRANENLMDYIDGFELDPGEYSLFTIRLERTSSSCVKLSITLNGKTQSDTDCSPSDQPQKINVFAVYMRNGRDYTRVVLRAPREAVTSAPGPTNGAEEIPTDVMLSWRGGTEATSHDVYFGGSFAAVNNATRSSGEYKGNQQAEIFDPSCLERGGTYYWRVDDVTESGTVKGPVWSFTTLPCAAFESFEAYENSDALEADWPAGGWAWVELAGEHRSGGKSLELDYYNRNVGGGAYSEATRTFEQPQNWSGGSSAGFYFKGLPSNQNDKLYLVLEDTAGATASYSGGVSNLCSENWQLWSASFEHFGGVDLGSVRKLTIGVGDRNGSPSSASGILYVDDLGLCGGGCEQAGCICPGDVNTDSQVDLEDLQAIAGVLLDAGSPFIAAVPPAPICADINGDSQADLDDLQAVAGILLNAGSPFIVPCE